MSLIVILEDSWAMAEAAARALREAGYEAVPCLTTSEAFSLCQERKADLVLTEYYVGDGTGLDLLEKLSRRDSAPPVAVATGCGNEEAAARALDLGARAWLVKSETYLRDLPFQVERLLNDQASRQAMKEKSHLKRRQEAQNELAEWLAHNFKNILAASIGYLNLVNLKNPGQDRAKQEKYLNESRQSQESGIQLLEQLIRMTASEAGEAERIIVAEVVDEAWETVRSKVLTVTRAQYPERLENVRAQIGQVAFLNSTRRLPPVNMVRADLESIMEALLQNALEAVLAHDEPRVLALGEMHGRTLELTVRDNGRGMSESVLKHALEPLFSTKGEVGVGLSLSLVSSLVVRHGGDVNLKSAPGAGTTVKITFPL